jgi:hypothetical protein
MMKEMALAGFVLILATMTAHAAGDTVVEKDWTFKDTGNGTAVAYTNDDSGSTLGVFCVAAKNCSVYLKTATGCADGAQYPVLVNTDSGALAVSLTCQNISSAGEKQNFVFVFDEFDAIFCAMVKDNALGVALPLAGGQFRVASFSLNGSNETIAAVNRTIESSLKMVTAKDQTL